MPDADFRLRLPDPIATGRLQLRAPNPGDIARPACLANDKKISDFLARLPHPYPHEHAMDFIDNFARPARKHAECGQQEGVAMTPLAREHLS